VELENMKLKSTLIALVVVAGAPFVALATLQEGMPAVEPGPEHAVLDHMVGTWDASVQMMGAPAADKGTSTTRVGMDGLWVVSDFEGAMMGGSFIGHDVLGYDQTKKKYVGCWVDSMNTGLTLTEGTWDEATKTLTMTGLEADPMMGSKLVMLTKVKDADHYTWTMHPGSADAPAVMTIEYARKK
jgi:hypothetical protein